MTIEEMISQAASKNQIDPGLFAALVMQESGKKPRVVSNKGAMGLAQLMPGTAKQYGVTDPFDPQQNLDAGARYLADLVKRYNGDIRKALAAYNAGPEAVDKYGGVPPFEETQNYVKNITEASQKSTKKGMVIYEGEDPRTGQKLRISVPRGTDPSTTQSLFDAESKRQEGFKKTIQPFKGDPYGFATEMAEKGPERVGEAALTGLKNIFTGGPLGSFGQGSKSPEEFEELQRIQSMPEGNQKQAMIQQYNAKYGGHQGEDVPILGSILRASRGTFTPEEADDLLISGAQGGIGGLGKRALESDFADKVGQGFHYGFRQNPGYSRVGAAVGGATGGAMGSPFGYPGIAIGGATGAALGSKVPGFMGAFRRGFNTPFLKSAPIDTVDATPTNAPNPYQQTAQNWAARQLQNTADARTQPPATPMPGATTPYSPSAGALRTGSPYPTTATPLESGAPVPQLPAASSIQMGPAHQVPVYGNQSVVRSPYTGGFMKRQVPLDLRQEGANIPGESGYQGPPPPREAGSQGFGEGLTDKDIQSLGKPYTPPLQMEETTQIPGKTITNAEIDMIAKKRGISSEEQANHFKQSGWSIVDEIPKEFSYPGKGRISVSSVTKGKGVTQVFTPSAVDEYARLHTGGNRVAAMKALQDEYGAENVEFPPDKGLKKRKKSSSEAVDVK